MNSNIIETTTKEAVNTKTTVRQIFRVAALVLFIIAIFAYFIPSFWGNTSVMWLAIGVIHTAMFSAIFFRNSRRRRVISVIFFVFLMIWNAIFLILLMPVFSSFMHVPIFAPTNLYAICSLVATILALALPRKISASGEKQP